jgi:hypothetical protein
MVRAKTNPLEVKIEKDSSFYNRRTVFLFVTLQQKSLVRI